MKASEHLWILMLEPVSLSEVLARVCLKTCDISTILLPGGAMWVFRAILALFMAPSTRIYREQVNIQRNLDNRWQRLMPVKKDLKHSWLLSLSPPETAFQLLYRFLRNCNIKPHSRIPCWAQASFLPERRQAVIPKGLSVRLCWRQESSLCRGKERLSVE